MTDQRDWIKSKIRTYKDNYMEDPPSIDEANRTLQFIEENADCFSRKNQQGHITGSAWIFNQDYSMVLLHHHRKIDQWIQLGGHSDDDWNTLDVAVKEAEEESGLKGFRVLSDEIFDIDVHEFPARKNEPAHLHYDIRFLLQISSDLPLNKQDRESKALEWIPLRELFSSDDYLFVRKISIKSLDYIAALQA
ncbi:MAG: NUDIX hydrolase [Holosporaceae bacterium]|nr:MAG: NUDIX hydrolase [Holosporaceae bacterium]